MSAIHHGKTWALKLLLLTSAALCTTGCFDTELNTTPSIVDDEPDTDGMDEPDGDDQPCEGGQENACGGCAELEGQLGDPCGTCDSGTLACADDNESLVCDGDGGEEATNACGGCAELDGVPDVDRCGTCDSGTLVCAADDNSLNCVGDGGDNALNDCGGCGVLAGDIDDACGTCNSGTLTCAEDNESLVCDGDGGDDILNECGGCATLAGAVDDACGTCNSGTLACDGQENLLCDGDQGEAARNACGGCAVLPGTPADSCGTCNTGTFVCANGGETLNCNNDQGDAALNDCGGCTPLEGIPNVTRCGECDLGVLTCANDNESLECAGDMGPGVRNVCGGCAVLPEGAEVGGECGQGECPGTFACDGNDLLICTGAGVNVCGGCDTLDNDPGDACGQCGEFVCNGDNAVRCEENLRTFFFDEDGDGFGETDDTRQLCAAEGNYRAEQGGDCNDDNPNVKPNIDEACDGQDTNCNGQIDEGVTNTCGGCGELEQDPGEPCLDCAPGIVACDGRREVACEPINEDLDLCGLNADCLFECGDGVCDPEESCGQCDLDCDCFESGCGDGIRDEGESCDDGNRIEDDMCTDDCQPGPGQAVNAGRVRVSPMQDNGFVASFIVPGQGNVAFQRFNEAGVRIDDDPITIPNSNQGGADTLSAGMVQMGDGSLFVVHKGTSGLVGNFFTSDCDPTPVTGRTNPLAGFMTTPELSDEFDVAALSGGQVAITWSDKDPMRPQSSFKTFIYVLDDEGTPANDNPPFIISPMSADEDTKPHIIPLSNGQFVVVWNRNGNGLRGRRFNTGGAPIGGEFPITNTEANIINSAGAGFNDGRFVVVWDVDGDVFLRSFSSTGTPQGNGRLVTTDGNGLQEFPDVAINSNNLILVTWQDGRTCNANCNTMDTTGRIFLGTGTELGGEFVIDQNTDLPIGDAMALRDRTFMATVDQGGAAQILKRVTIPAE